MRELLVEFEKRRARIRDWLAAAKNRWHNRKSVLFYLVFSLCTPQSKASLCDIAVEKLLKKGILSANISSVAVSKELKGVRFPNRKAQYIIEALKKFPGIYGEVQKLHTRPRELREWLVKNVKGYGYKEASHFLRNIGIDEDMAILDVHILRTLRENGLIGEDEGQTGGVSPKQYLSIEKKFCELAVKLGLKPAELDIAIWLARSGNAEIM